MILVLKIKFLLYYGDYLPTYLGIQYFELISCLFVFLNDF